MAEDRPPDPDPEAVELDGGSRRPPEDGSAVADAGGESAPAASPPQRVGPYRLVRELGRSGMGRVFLAEQETPDFRRTVALKLIDRPGPDEEAVRRFRAEVRILASLDHPGIVRFLDGGKSPEGVWFLAREYVEGEDLLTHASQRSLDLPDRLRLFLGVVEAVAFAHQRGAVHRDLKPTNILVGRDGRPRLLDFGISKLHASADAEKATVTRTDWRPLTPAYASPEQLAGEPATPASDVYSLGVVLDELLAGARRRAPTGRRRSGAGGRGGRDLAAIRRLAIQRNPADRYPSAAALAEDLARHLAGRRVRAGQGEPRPLRGRVRDRGARLAAAITLPLLVGSILWWARPGSEAPSTPPPARSVRFPFDPVNPPPVEEMVRRLATAPDDFAAGAALAIGLEKQRRSGEATIVIGRLRQVPGGETDPLVDYAEGRLATLRNEDQRALVLYTRARDRAVAQGREELLCTIRWGRGGMLAGAGQRDAAREELERARADCERTEDYKGLYRTLNELAIEHLQRGEMAPGEATLESALAAARHTDLEPLTVLSNLAEVKFLRGRPDLAEPLAREILALRRRDPGTVREVDELARLSLVVRDLGRPHEAETLLEQALSLSRSLGPSSALANALHLRARADLAAGRLDRIDALAEELEGAAQTDLRVRPLGYAQSVRAQAAALRGDLAAARQRFAEARRLLLSEGNPDLAALSDLGWAEAETRAGSPEDALRVLEEALGALDEEAATLPGFFAEALRARIEAARGRAGAARRSLERLGEEGARSPSVARRIAYLWARAGLAAAEARPQAARADLEAALAVARSSDRKLDELELRLDLAALAGDPEARWRLAAEVEGEASRLGLPLLAERARGRGAGDRQGRPPAGAGRRARRGAASLRPAGRPAGGRSAPAPWRPRDPPGEAPARSAASRAW